MSCTEDVASLAEQFCQQLIEYLSHCKSEGRRSDRLAIAYSGGLDSTALLHLSARFCKALNIQLFAFHVHHGLNANADNWLAHCKEVATSLDVPFSFQKVQVNTTGEGLEAAARSSRYYALAKMAAEFEVQTILFAHHQDDQLETILMRMFRGAGLEGLGGMRAKTPFPFASDSDLHVFRPFLHVRRQDLDALVTESGWAYVQDGSNEDVRFLRNAIRHQLVPVMESIKPAVANTLVRSGRLLQDAADLLSEYIAKDFELCKDDLGLNLRVLEKFGQVKRRHVLRYWLRQFLEQLPSERLLTELDRQIMRVQHDQMLNFEIGTFTIRVFRNSVYLQSNEAKAGLSGSFDVIFQWNCEAILQFPQFGGSLLFQEADEGIPERLLSEVALSLHLRRGGERIRLARGRPTRTLKQHYQQAAIPVLLRNRLPLVSGPAGLIYVAGLGMNADLCSNQAECAERKIQISWQSNLIKRQITQDESSDSTSCVGHGNDRY